MDKNSWNWNATSEPCFQLTWSTAKADRSIPKKAKMAPTKAVLRIPYWSASKLDMAESPKVAPVPSEATKDAFDESPSYFSFKDTNKDPLELWMPKITPLHRKAQNITNQAWKMRIQWFHVKYENNNFLTLQPPSGGTKPLLESCNSELELLVFFMILSFFEVILAASSAELELEAMTKYFWDKVESEDELVEVKEVSSSWWSVDANGVLLGKSPAMMASKSVVFDEVAILESNLSVRWKNLQSNEIFEKLDTYQLWPPPYSFLLNVAQWSLAMRLWSP